VAVSVGLASVLLAGCNEYDRRYKFGPKPIEVGHELPGEAQGAVASAMVSVVGLRKRDRQANRPAAMEVRLRVENHGDVEATVAPGALQLFAGNLEPFPEPLVDSDGPVTVRPGGNATITAFFPFPGGKYPGTFDLDGLAVRWTVTVADVPITRTATFTRRRDYDYYPTYPVYYHPYGIGLYRRPLLHP
jgi:hypothetical protein